MVSRLIDDVEVVEITAELISFVDVLDCDDDDDEGNDDGNEDEVDVADVVVSGVSCRVDAWIGNWLLWVESMKNFYL